MRYGRGRFDAPEVPIFMVEILVKGTFQQVVAGRHSSHRLAGPVRDFSRRDDRL